MALKNAFEYLATESSLRRIIALLGFARDSSDRLRITVDSGTINNAVIWNRGSTNTMNADTSAGYQNALSWNSVDAREPLKLQHALRSDFVKRDRWTF